MPTDLSTGHDRATWIVGKQVVVLDDCLIALRRMKASSIDVIITSPPYNIGVAYKSYDDNKPRKGLSELA